MLGTAPVGMKVAAFVVPFAAGMLVLEELRKWLARKRLLDPASRGGPEPSRTR